ncbi:hypothetical protein GCM10009629_51210 [Pseudonocardia alni]
MNRATEAATSSASTPATTNDHTVPAPAMPATITGVAAIAAEGADPAIDWAATSAGPSRRRARPCTGDRSRNDVTTPLPALTGDPRPRTLAAHVDAMTSDDGSNEKNSGAVPAVREHHSR